VAGSGGNYKFRFTVQNEIKYRLFQNLVDVFILELLLCEALLTDLISTLPLPPRAPSRGCEVRVLLVRQKGIGPFLGLCRL